MAFEASKGTSTLACAIEASNREGLWRLVRYCARPAICAERLSLLPDGRIADQLPNARGATHRVMTPLELVARVIALIPPPHHHLVRYHGVFAPHYAWRAEIIAMCPACPTKAPTCGVHHVPAQQPLALAAPDAADLAPAENPDCVVGAVAGLGGLGDVAVEDLPAWMCWRTRRVASACACCRWCWARRPSAGGCNGWAASSLIY